MMEKIEFTVSMVRSRAWELTKKHGLIIAVVLFVIAMLTQTISMLGFPTQAYMSALTNGDAEAALALFEGLGTLTATSLLAWVINAVLTTGVLRCVILIAKGEMVNFELSGFKMPFTTYVYFILATILVGIIVGLGTCLCIIPGIFLGVRLILVCPHILEHPEDGLGGAFKHSWNVTKGHFWSLFGLLLLYVLFCFLGLLCCCIGMYFAVAMGYFMLVVAYLILSNKPADVDTTQPITEQVATTENVD